MNTEADLLHRFLAPECVVATYLSQARLVMPQYTPIYWIFISVTTFNCPALFEQFGTYYVFKLLFQGSSSKGDLISNKIKLSFADTLSKVHLFYL